MTREKPDAHRCASHHAKLRDLLGFRVGELHAAEAARELAEDRYLDDQGALFPDLSAAWNEQVASTEVLGDLAVRLAEVAGAPQAEAPEMALPGAGAQDG